ncbi:peptide chain release factor N(5)-glutamine methyltransferase [Parabacteroides sp. PF5-9]|uniref:peptide chain release factor N(5)-glutamine methyltransferase n=1 Tax=Parabacteroides sp. PF5-9 TaxID=1742404 RepID=UPI002476028A|nr:peptide chain release factor N(5)-glutamine methyltransferase [Parabacteroides sp. PF5-9]MDH6356283.1 release factor glutamine methyltransferase [Parabacteroides sp. PF5-9]
MTESIAYIRKSLEAIYSPEETGSLTRLILEEVCGLQPHRLLIDKDKQLTDDETLQIEKILTRLKHYEPIQYVLGKAYFYGLTLRVNPAVLIPRPETEELVDLIIQNQKESKIRLLDIGTGSGCIAIALGKNLPDATITGIDISEDALKTAAINARENQVDVQLLHVDILSETETETNLPGYFDVIVSNPPYVMEKEKEGMGRNVLQYEPPGALFVPDDDPLLFYRRIARLAYQKLTPEGQLYFEINAQCGDETVDMLQKEGYNQVELIQDLCGKERIIKAQR